MRHTTIVLLAFLAGSAFASSFVDEPTYQQMQVAYASGTALKAAELPAAGVIPAYAVTRNGDPGTIDVAFAKTTGGVRIFMPANDKLSNPDAVRHLTDCDGIIPAAVEDAPANALVQWMSVRDVRAVWYYSHLEQRAINRDKTSWRVSTLDGKKVYVARQDIDDPGFGWTAGAYPYPGPNPFAAAHMPEWMYLVGSELKEIAPSAVEPNCHSLVTPYSWRQMLVNG